MSTIKVAINGFGRIGRLVFRQIHNMQGIDVVAINDLTSPATLAHLLKYDSAQGRFNEEVTHTDSAIIVNGHEVKITPKKTPLKFHGVHIRLMWLLKVQDSLQIKTKPPLILLQVQKEW